MNDQAVLVQASFSRVFAKKGALTDRFYHYLFLERPEVEGLFKQSFGAQKEMFSAMLALVVKELSQPGAFDLLAAKLREQHAPYDISVVQWQSAADALVMSLRDVLKDDMTDAEDKAWSETTNRLVAAMSSASDS